MSIITVLAIFPLFVCITFAGCLLYLDWKQDKANRKD